MELSYTKFTKAIIALSGLDAGDLAKKLSISRSTLSREISKNTFLRIRHYFEKYDTEVNEAIDLIIEHFEYEMFEEIEKLWLNEPNSNYRVNNKDAEIRHLKSIIKQKEKIENLLERQYQDKCKEVDKLEFELSELNRPNKQIG